MLLFDILRILAIFIVVFAHICQFTHDPLGGFNGIPGFYWVSLGGVGVTIFLVVSGCSLAYNHEAFSSFGQIVRFYQNRIIRIYPAYWLALIVTVLIYLALIPGYANTLSGKTLLLTFSGLYVFLDQWGGPIFSIGWFIGLILALYALYPLILYLFNKAPNGTLLLLFTVSVASRVACGYLQSAGIGYRLIDWVPLCRVFEFGLGIYIVKAGLYARTINIPANPARIIAFASDLSFPIFLIHYSFYQSAALYAALASIVQISLSVYVAGSIVAFIILALAIYSVDRFVQRSLGHGPIMHDTKSVAR